MKRLITTLLCVALVVSLAGCVKVELTGMNTGTEAPQAQDTSSAATSNEEPQEGTTNPSKPEVSVDEKIEDPDDGTVLDVDLTKRGQIKSGPDMSANEFVLDGITLELPFAASKLFDKGWHFSENSTAAEELLDPNTTTNLVSFYLYNSDGSSIMLEQAVNDSDTAKPVGECDISAIGIHTYELTEAFGDLILPGGICLYSTAADVVSVYGTPENNEYFESVTVSEHGIGYIDHKDTGLSYSFHFYDSEDYDGQLEGQIASVSITTDY